MSIQALINQEMASYLGQSAEVEPEPLRRLRLASRNVPNARWNLNPHTCNFLRLLIRLTGACRALELGTFVGCSGTAIALALPPEGTLLTCDVNPAAVGFARKFWARHQFGGKIESRIMPALELLDELTSEEHRFDFAFIDADKPNYPVYFERILALLNPGGLMVFDNVLWHGRVAAPPVGDAYAAALASFNAILRDDRRVESVLVPIGDGLALIRKGGEGI
ncbi:MAG: hypothetical protein A2521_01740 [Deltaproteobacteria bacterium RIFOXYD12_FULL_57_12]|nr:MAG: hypothetical protein A2521_01740 [Deltaproteobacteria bacterium RIFOXYD12_FULL_57_12]